ncbi:uncharacterized protein L969DRAFT_96648 [Mixia osmundae IAM 14324]|uniref:Response regulatory domain-containing protein n=1 Tax=Mixia osmundae (strain CBS 9802 / IAM 14324 / JCM 22182 / KY 12970) TaxID=764103 RepID=G7EB27_MIXOS|nr:uncharacterized protein L969DRAFT_96648 [Mixia osmundae IAM 14324]KEI37068.1 hypothetical protein L969DRAFT_96648 [Mixia osmundae IAM 14324]GAB00038.1 hypothetical protein E5Q_06740 [Mixia osmundae IAM 14324]
MTQSVPTPSQALGLDPARSGLFRRRQDGSSRPPTPPAASPSDARVMASRSLTAQSSASLQPLEPSKKLSVLVVDDNALNRAILMKLLRTHFTHLLEDLSSACDSAEALSTLKGGQAIDLVLLDINLGVDSLTGVEICRLLRRGFSPVEVPASDNADVSAQARLDAVLKANKNQFTQVIAVTTDVSDTQISTYQNAGFDGCLAKPLRLPSLGKLLDLALASHEQQHAFTETDLSAPPIMASLSLPCFPSFASRSTVPIFTNPFGTSLPKSNTPPTAVGTPASTTATPKAVQADVTPGAKIAASMSELSLQETNYCADARKLHCAQYPFFFLASQKPSRPGAYARALGQPELAANPDPSPHAGGTTGSTEAVVPARSIRTLPDYDIAATTPDSDAENPLERSRAQDARRSSDATGLTRTHRIVSLPTSVRPAPVQSSSATTICASSLSNAAIETAATAITSPGRRRISTTDSSIFADAAQFSQGACSPGSEPFTSNGLQRTESALSWLSSPFSPARPQLGDRSYSSDASSCSSVSTTATSEGVDAHSIAAFTSITDEIRSNIKTSEKENTLASGPSRPQSMLASPPGSMPGGGRRPTLADLRNYQSVLGEDDEMLGEVLQPAVS